MTILKMPYIAKNLYADSIAQRVVLNFVWSTLSRVVGSGVLFFTNIYLARALGVNNFGLFTLAQTITLYFWIAVDLGTNLYGIREIAKHKNRAEAIINPLLTLRITAGLTVFFIYTASLFLFDMPLAKKLVFATAGLYLVSYSFYTEWILKGLEKFKYIVIGSLITSIAYLIGVIFLVKGSHDAVVASTVWALSYFFGSLSLLIVIRNKLNIRFRPLFDFKIWVIHVRQSIPFTLAGSLFALIQCLPIVILGIFFNSYEVGLFSAPYKIITAACGVGLLLSTSFYPVFSELHHKDRVKFHKTRKKFEIIMLLLGFPVAVLGTIFSNQIINLLLGKEYFESIEVFKIIVWLIPLYFLSYTYGSLLLAAGFQMHHNIPAIAGVICMSILGFVLIPNTGVIGASWTVIAAQISIVVSMLLVSQFTYNKS
jgi:O-antigen/teichoic acid export membrane protein